MNPVSHVGHPDEVTAWNWRVKSKQSSCSEQCSVRSRRVAGLLWDSQDKVTGVCSRWATNTPAKHSVVFPKINFVKGSFSVSKTSGVCWTPNVPWEKSASGHCSPLVTELDTDVSPSGWPAQKQRCAAFSGGRKHGKHSDFLLDEAVIRGFLSSSSSSVL